MAQQLGATVHGEKRETVHGFNVRHWTEGGLDFWAVSDINAGELDEFCQKLTAALHPPRPAFVTGFHGRYRVNQSRFYALNAPPATGRRKPAGRAGRLSQYGSAHR